jgi:hypothetical protein
MNRDCRIEAAAAAQRELIDKPDMPTTRRAHLVRLARLKYLAPDIVTAILDGRHPVQLTARRLLCATDIPIAWDDQRVSLGFI